MNWLDILLIVILVVSVISGIAKGLARTGIGLAAALAGLLCGLWFYSKVARLIEPPVPSRAAANLIGFFAVFAAVLVLGILLARSVETLFVTVRLSWLNRLLGGAFGVVRAVVVGVVVVLIVMAFPTTWPPGEVARSRFAPYMVDAAHAVAAAAPQEVRTGFRRSYNKIREMWNDSTDKTGRRPATEQI